MQDTDGAEQVARQIAAQLGETAFAPQRQIQRIVTALGVTRAQALLAEALAVEARGGLLLPDGSRRRTPGGVFFQLVKTRVSARQCWLLFRRSPPRRAKQAPAGATVLALTWAARLPAAREAQQQQGVIDDVKIILVGRPGVVVSRPNCVITAMSSTRGPSLPKGLPVAPTTPTNYTVYIAHKHWAGVAEAMTNPDDSLVVEGWAAFDPELEGIAVFATFITTQLTRTERKGQRR
ncbi:hypothetical protein K2Z83_26725 [Oscillochloris sp. ZM17-4]|uniref:hypothetical protein n=1 Tax=Oscillochloris sp. ZM17-4 TaxID=2866714 RepID=UPI001C73C3D4|nr:hypothetical protein [Oscillochloris sp. ZM17-4]MBX0331248.1 hypothetical protein [Oscillochloris sp. ZM17-4]